MSDTETIRSGVLLIAALIGLAAAIISFVNSRLNEAKTPEQANRVWLITFSTLDLLLFIIGMLLLFLSHFDGYGKLLLCLSLVTTIGFFIFGGKNVSRLEVANLVVRFVSVFFIITIFIVGELRGNIAEILDVLDKIVDAFNTNKE